MSVITDMCLVAKLSPINSYNLLRVFAINALRQLHKSEEFYKDIVETTVDTSSETGTSVQITRPIGFRRWVYIRPIISGVEYPPLEQSSPMDAIIRPQFGRPKVDSLGNALEKTGIYYIAGEYTTCNIGETPTSLRVGYLRIPVIANFSYTDGTTIDPIDSDWIVRDHPELVMALTLSQYYHDSGRLQEAAKKEQEVMQLRPDFFSIERFIE